MKEALKGLFSSKKAIAGIAGAGATALILLAQKHGYGLDPEATKLLVGAVLGLAGLFIVGQGAADWGKEAVKIQEAAMGVYSTTKDLEQEWADDLVEELPKLKVLTEEV